MKAKSAILILLLTATALVTLTTAKTLKVGYYANAPMISESAEGEPEGIFIDFLESVAEQQGWQLDYVFGSFAELTDAVKAGDIDILPCITTSYDRLQVMSFTRQPLLENWAILLRRNDVAVNNFFDLEGKRVTSLKGDIHQIALRQMLERYQIECEIIEVDDYETAVRMLDEGKGDVAAVSRTFSTRRGSFFDSTSTLLIYNPIPLHYAFPKGQHLDVIHALDEAYAIQSIDPNSTLLLSMARLLRPDTPFQVPVWIYVFGVTLLMIALAFGIAALLLRTMVNRKTAELQSETVRATEALRAQNLFLATLSHELRTPLNFIIGPLDILRDELEITQTERQELLNDCRDGIDRLQHLLLSLLRFSKVDNENFILEKKPVLLKPLLQEIIQVAEALPRRDTVSLISNIEVSPDLTALTDEDAIFQIALNLLHNALKYTEQGQVEFSVKANDENSKITFSLMVKDTGKGIPKENYETIFTPFLKGTKNNYVEAGTGLGLSIVDRLVKSFGGNLRFTSQENMGTTFRVTLILEGAELITE